MSRIDARFEELRGRGERALVPFVTCGDPDLATSELLLPAIAEAGADLIEVGVPFSDPLGDGPTIQRASERALRAGSSLRRTLELIKKLRPQLDTPIVLMSYANVFLAMGESNFAAAAREVGVDGVITVDLPPEEGALLFDGLERAGIDPVLLASPTTPEARLSLLAERTRGFLYYVSLTGVTGARAHVAADVEQSVRGIRRLSEVPVCVGFGISTPEQAEEVGRYADGVVVGSALVDRIGAAESPKSAVAEAARFVADLKRPLR